MSERYSSLNIETYKKDLYDLSLTFSFIQNALMNRGEIISSIEAIYLILPKE